MQSAFPTTVAPLTAEQRNALLVEWQHAAEQLAILKDKEMALRLQIAADSGLFDQQKEKGTQTYQLGGGWKLKLERKLSYKIENKQGEAFNAMHQLTSMGEGTARIAKSLFSFDANLRTSEYEKLSVDEKRIIDAILTVKPATPSLSLEAPKDAK